MSCIIFSLNVIFLENNLPALSKVDCRAREGGTVAQDYLLGFLTLELK